MMGLIHVCLGSVSMLTFYNKCSYIITSDATYYNVCGPSPDIGGYPFWGGAFVSTWFDFEIESQFAVPVVPSLGLETQHLLPIPLLTFCVQRMDGY